MTAAGFGVGDMVQDYEMSFTDFSVTQTTMSCAGYSDLSCHGSNLYDSAANYMAGTDWTSFGMNAVSVLMILGFMSMAGLYLVYFVVSKFVRRYRASHPKMANAGMPQVHAQPFIPSAGHSSWAGYAGRMPAIVKMVAAPLLKLLIRALFMISKLVAWSLLRLRTVHSVCIEMHVAMVSKK